jgi:hypothetical protein
LVFVFRRSGEFVFVLDVITKPPNHKNKNKNKATTRALRLEFQTQTHRQQATPKPQTTNNQTPTH